METSTISVDFRSRCIADNDTSIDSLPISFWCLWERAPTLDTQRDDSLPGTTRLALVGDCVPLV